jgi:Secretion system C-terminal sorting domain
MKKLFTLLTFTLFLCSTLSAATYRNATGYTYKVVGADQEITLWVSSDPATNEKVGAQIGYNLGASFIYTGFTFSPPAPGGPGLFPITITIPLAATNIQRELVSQNQSGGNYGYTGLVAIGSPTPVELQSFSGSAQTSSNELSWKTVTEINNNYFDVQRSANGQDWASIGQVKGNGTTNVSQSYTFVDNSPLAGINYYRLNQVDFDASSQFSTVISVVRKAGLGVVAVTPNPAKDRIRLNTELDLSDKNIAIYDVLGREVFSSKDGDANIDVANLPSAIYIVRISDLSGLIVAQSKFLKN